MSEHDYTFKSDQVNNVPTAFGPPWYGVLLTLATNAPSSSGTAVFDGPGGTSNYDIATDADGNLVLTLSPPVELVLDSTLIITIGGGFTTVAATLEFSSTPETSSGNAGPGIRPKMSLSISNDGGKTYNAPRQRSLGKLGEYSRLVKWPQLGRSNNRVLWIECSEPVQVSIVEADLDVIPEGR